MQETQTTKTNEPRVLTDILVWQGWPSDGLHDIYFSGSINVFDGVDGPEYSIDAIDGDDLSHMAREYKRCGIKWPKVPEKLDAVIKEMIELNAT